MARVSKKTKLTRKRSGMLLISGVVLILCVIFVFNSFEMKERIRERDEVVADLEAQISQQEQMKEDLIRESEYIRTDEYIEEEARSMGMIYDNEIIFKKEDSSK